MHRFKPGDKVVCTGIHGGKHRVGATAIVGDYYFSGTSGTEYLRIEWDRNNPLSGGQGDGGYCEDSFKLVEEAVKTDEELAAEYRAARETGFAVGAELRKRGYVVSNSNGVIHPSRAGSSVTIRKTWTETKDI